MIHGGLNGEVWSFILMVEVGERGEREMLCMYTYLLYL